MSRKMWNVIPYDKKRAVELANQTGTDEFAVLLLLSRGFDTPEKIYGFFDTSLGRLSSPFLLKDMDKAVDRIRSALDNREKILIYGDYDADGVTATALLYTYLEATGADVSYFIPSRITEGYGLSLAIAEKIAEKGYRLVITVDNGIAALEEAAFFKTKGIDMIVTDHHQTGDVYPDAVAVIDPHRPDDTCPYKDTAGVGVALKLVAALEDGDYETVFEDFGDLVTIGTIADIVPLTGENRIIVANGLPLVKNTSRPGLVRLTELLGIADKPITSSVVAYSIAPKINAAGRMDSADKAVELLLTEDEAWAGVLAEGIMDANNRRQAAETAILSEAAEAIEKSRRLQNERVLVVAGKNWHPGVIGIAAARLVEMYGKPAIVISVSDNGICRGSCRSIEGFSLYDALSACKDTLIQFGGHTLAAGFSVEENKIEVFADAVNAYAARQKDIYPVLPIDCRLNPGSITAEILDSLERLEPFGAEHPSPVFGLFGMQITSVKGIGNNRHLRITLSKQGSVISAVYFGVTPQQFSFREGDTVDLAVKIEKNEYMGETRVSIQIKDIRPSGSDDIAVFTSLKAFENLKRGDRLSDIMRKNLLPERSLFAAVYRFVKETGICSLSPELICFRLHLDGNLTGAVKVCLETLTEVGVLQKLPEGYRDAGLKKKADLSTGLLLSRLNNG